MIAKLVPQIAEDASHEFVLRHLPATLGRGDEATFCLNDRWVSRVHCEIDEVEGRLVVRDLGSKHGTIVNGSHTETSPLLPGDQLSVGMQTFEVVYEPSRSDDSVELRRRHPR